MQEGMRKHKPPDEGRFAPQGERAQTEIPGLGVDVSCPTFILRPAQRFSHSPPEQHGQAATHRRARGKGPGGEGACFRAGKPPGSEVHFKKCSILAKFP